MSSHRGKKFTKDHRVNISRGRIGMIFSESHRNNLSKASSKAVSINYRFYPNSIEVSKQYGVTPGSVGHWLRGRCNPHPKHGIYQISYIEV